MEFPHASKIRKTKARPRKTFPFLRRPRHPYPIRISPTAPIPTFKVLWKVLKYAKLSEYHSNSENTHPETIFHYAKAPVWLTISCYQYFSFYVSSFLTLTPILLRLAPMMGLTMNTVISKAPNTRPKCQTSSPLLTASRGKNGAWNMERRMTRSRSHHALLNSFKMFFSSHKVEN